ncbi:uncharacterized protein IL334_005979 [Kwoniella shivajii]|uniref:Epidermal growth factor receptor-like transmembrane-juxtamembrane segment domain-containing protein n=1 Tax=Kwoniella shivajii TaxID=564305 RepID=A0ABZ1D8M6_9TREE|nr:hypothetical protein IL334_005979 [Kwoniella shivajii]
MRFTFTSLGLLPFFLQSINAFTFSTSTPVQCQNFTIQWSGGTPPYHFSLVPTITVNGGHIMNISIPTDLQSPYEYSFNLEQPTGLDFLATMSDSTGFGAGGTTSVLTVGSSSDSSCVPSSLSYDFTFYVTPDSNPTSCSSMAVTWLENATEPVSLFGMIPHGTAFSIPIDQSSTTYDWTVDIRENTQFLLFMSDAGQYQTGGSTPLYRVQSGNTNCITSSSPTTASGDSMTYATSATASSSSASASVSGVGGSSSGGSSDTTSKKTNTGAIAGGAVGGVAFLVLLSLLLFFCVKRRAARKNDRSDPSGLKSYGVGSAAAEKTNKRRSNQLDLAEEGDYNNDGDGVSNAPSRQVEMNGDVYEPSPFRYPSPPETPATGVALGAAGLAGAGTGTGTGTPNRMGIQPSNQNTPEMLAMASEKAQNGHSRNTSALGVPPTIRTSGESVQRPGSLTPSTPTGPGSHGIPETEDSNRATLGHSAAPTAVATAGAGTGRMSSIRKTPSSQHVNAASSPTVSAPGQQGTPTSAEREPRFVQHEDAEVIDLPPRYDQLRTRNPDQ